MSAKSRGRRNPASQAGRTPDPRELVADFGTHFAAADNALDAELLAATLLAMPHRYGGGRQTAELFISLLIEAAGDDPGPEAAALLRGLAAVAPPHLRRRAVAALGEVTGAGHYPPEWAAQIGRATPGEAWCRHDVYGDTETIAVSYSYGDAEHAVLVQIDRCREPTVLDALVASEVTELRSMLDDDDEPLVRAESIDLAQARSRLAGVLARDDIADHVDLNDRTLIALPIARTRLRRLPAGDPPPPPTYDAADRSAAVAEFLASPQAAEAGDEKVARYWAEVFAGYSAWLPGDPPGRIGPRKLSQVLYAYVPNSFALGDEQRRGMPAAVTAWTRWAAARQQLDGAALARLEEYLPEVIGGFDEAYDDPDNSQLRGYLADVSATTTDAAALADALNRRALAVPVPSERGDDESLRRLDAADPASRRTLIEHEYGECQPPEGMRQPEFLDATVGVCEQLWSDDPPELWQRAQHLLDTGTSNHDAIHRLVAG
jgi:hypothetical protein